MNEKKLLELKATIETKKAEMEKLKGRKEQLLSDLQNTYQCKSISAAEKKITSLTESLEALKTQFEEGVLELKEYGLTEED